MPKYVIERELPGAGKMTREQLREVAQKSNGILHTLGPKIQWVETFVSDDKLYCVYNAPSPKLIEEHAKCGGFPANRISQVRAIMDPTTAEAS
jgi:Protein of unknown function (DUF4242)